MINGDLIIDCFAGGGGASVGIEMALGRPVDIAINHDPQAIPVKERVAKIGNSVVPIMAEALVAANCPYLIVGERIPNMMISTEQTGQLRFA